MDDPQFVEAARALAQNALLSENGQPERGFEYMAERLLARSFDPKEDEIVKRSYADYLSYYDAKPEDAAKLLSVRRIESRSEAFEAGVCGDDDGGQRAVKSGRSIDEVNHGLFR